MNTPMEDNIPTNRYTKGDLLKSLVCTMVKSKVNTKLSKVFVNVRLENRSVVQEEAYISNSSGGGKDLES